MRFQFTHPGKGATSLTKHNYSLFQVSIHAPWEGCDEAQRAYNEALREFQFTHPGKGATVLQIGAMRFGGFQFTHPGKGATRHDHGHNAGYSNVSIHAPWEGCDGVVVERAVGIDVSIHAPWEGCDYTRTLGQSVHLGFNSRTLGRVRPPPSRRG